MMMSRKRLSLNEATHQTCFLIFHLFIPSMLITQTKELKMSKRRYMRGMTNFRV